MGQLLFILVSNCLPMNFKNPNEIWVGKSSPLTLHKLPCSAVKEAELETFRSLSYTAGNFCSTPEATPVLLLTLVSTGLFHILHSPLPLGSSFFSFLNTLSGGATSIAHLQPAAGPFCSSWRWVWLDMRHLLASSVFPSSQHCHVSTIYTF